MRDEGGEQREGWKSRARAQESGNHFTNEGCKDNLKEIAEKGQESLFVHSIERNPRPCVQSESRD